jgi:beta-lactamase superfamily II metal-dependent hydrolase
VIICAEGVGSQQTLAIRLFYGKTQILLLSDGEKKRNAPQNDALVDLSPTILKVPEHGHWNLQDLSPRVMVVSGRARRKSIPLLHREEIPTFATAQDGAVTVESDGVTTEVKGFTGRRLHLFQAGDKEARWSGPK